jgi:AcrR family transcriptional regulator
MLGSTRVPRSSKRRAYRPKKKPRQARSRATYKALLDAGARVLIRHGYAALTTNHVAEVAGVAIGSLYEYFPDKETIVAEIVRRTVKEIVDEVTRGYESVLTVNFPIGLRSWVRAIFAAVRARRDLVRAIWRDVPFLHDLEEVIELQSTLVALAFRGRERVANPLIRAHPEAMIWLLTVMSAHAIVEGVVAPPRHISQEELEACFEDLMAGLLA